MELTKKEAAELLGIKVRTLELYTKQGKVGVKYIKGRYGKEARYLRSELEKFASNSQVETHKPTIVKHNPSQGIVKPLAIPYEGQEKSVVPIVTEQLIGLSAGVEKAILLKSKILLTLKDASLLTSLSEHNIKQAIHSKELPAKKIGKGWKIKRSDLDFYVENL